MHARRCCGCCEASRRRSRDLSLPGLKVLDFPKYDASFFGEVWGGTGSDVEARDADGRAIRVHNSATREPGAKLRGADAGLLVHQFAGDGNAYPGNEY